jgi:hypothetical protein
MDTREKRGKRVSGECGRAVIRQGEKHKAFGRLPYSELSEPSVDLAKEGEFSERFSISP